ncbi:hypothetical protein PMAYCL1PPCAC_01374, partial [Pristionchus mayeri]
MGTVQTYSLALSLRHVLPSSFSSSEATRRISSEQSNTTHLAILQDRGEVAAHDLFVLLLRLPPSIRERHQRLLQISVDLVHISRVRLVCGVVKAAARGDMQHVNLSHCSHQTYLIRNPCDGGDDILHEQRPELIRLAHLLTRIFGLPF